MCLLFLKHLGKYFIVSPLYTFKSLYNTLNSFFVRSIYQFPNMKNGEIIMFIFFPSYFPTIFINNAS